MDSNQSTSPQAPAPEINIDAVVEAENQNTGRWRGIGCLLVTILAVGLSLVVGFQLIGILYAILLPANPPLPDNITEISHDNLDYGVDEWVYSTAEDACQIVEFFEQQGASCNVAPGACSETGFVPASPNTQNIGTCVGEDDFSIFLMRWEAVITIGYRDEESTRFYIERAVLWSSNTPVSTSAPSPN